MIYFQKSKKIKKKNFLYRSRLYLGRKEKLFGWRSKTKNYSIVHGAAIYDRFNNLIID